MQDRIFTARAVITPLAPGDAPALSAYYLRNAAHLAPWEPLRPEGYHDPAAWQGRVAEQLAEVAEGRAFRHVARRPGQEEILSVINLTNVVRGVFQACSLGYSIDAAAQGQGLMAEVLAPLIDRLFAVEGLHRVMANYMPSNTRSGRVLQRLGFEEEGRARDYLMIAGRWEDHVLTARIAPPR